METKKLIVGLCVLNCFAPERKIFIGTELFKQVQKPHYMLVTCSRKRNKHETNRQKVKNVKNIPALKISTKEVPKCCSVVLGGSSAEAFKEYLKNKTKLFQNFLNRQKLLRSSITVTLVIPIFIA